MGYGYVNNGEDPLEFEDRTSQSGIERKGYALAFGDVDLDGFVDVWFEDRLYRNNGNDNHWLRVEPVGIQSNRSGIGARLIATSGDLTQTREILGGRGYVQDELVARFGLGQRTQVDRLEIRWPSGQVDVLENIPADQKIRAFEGWEEVHVVGLIYIGEKGQFSTVVDIPHHIVRKPRPKNLEIEV